LILLLKIGEYNCIILFDNIFNPINKVLETFSENIEKENNNDYIKVLFKGKSAFRIGVIRVEAFYLKDVLTKNNTYNFNAEKFKSIIKELCKNHKQSMFLIPTSNIVNGFKKEIYNILEEVVRDTKVTILN
jgi:hypothetical protein